jgi:Ca2+-binding EF-hand superfamily protein
MELRKCFDQYDTANDGTISFEEFKAALELAKYPEEQVKSIFQSIDVNKNGVIMYTEFIAAALEAAGHIEEERVAEAFDRLDSDDSGFISKENLKEFLGADATLKQIEEIMKDGDSDNDGKSKFLSRGRESVFSCSSSLTYQYSVNPVSWEEFLLMFRKQQTSLMQKQLHRTDSTFSDVDSTLVGLDAKIPGGKFDSTLTANSE